MLFGTYMALIVDNFMIIHPKFSLFYRIQHQKRKLQKNQKNLEKILQNWAEQSQHN